MAPWGQSHQLTGYVQIPAEAHRRARKVFMRCDLKSERRCMVAPPDLFLVNESSSPELPLGASPCGGNPTVGGSLVLV